MIPELVLIALLAGWLSGGRFLRLADARILYGWLIFIPLGMYLSAWAVALSPLSGSLEWFSGFSHIVEKAAFLLLVLLNLRVTGAPLILAGMALNLIALAANGGMMPANPDALVAAFGADQFDRIAGATHVRSAIMDAGCSLGFLCDIIVARRPFVLVPAVYSVGDVILSTGIFIAIIRLMRAPAKADCAGKD